MLDAATVHESPSALRCWQGVGLAMSQAHRHDDIEINLVHDQPLTYLFGGSLLEIQPGEAAIFWAAVPHRLIECPQKWSPKVCWLHVPLRIVLTWQLPKNALTTLFGGVPLVSQQTEYPGVAEFQRWSNDLASGLDDIVLLEIQAGLRRLLHHAGPAEREPHAEGAVQHVITMAQFIMSQFGEQITAADIARAAHLHPTYAMTLFRQVVGVTMHTYLLERRVAEAQRLLMATNRTIGQIAIGAGFGSQSGFYEAFVRSCNQTPGEYRRNYKTSSGSVTQPQRD